MQDKGHWSKARAFVETVQHCVVAPIPFEEVAKGYTENCRETPRCLIDMLLCIVFCLMTVVIAISIRIRA